MREFFYRYELKRIMRKKAAKPLTFSNSYQFTIVRGIFYNSQILDKKKITSGKVSTSFVEQLQTRRLLMMFCLRHFRERKQKKHRTTSGKSKMLLRRVVRCCRYSYCVRLIVAGHKSLSFFTQSDSRWGRAGSSAGCKPHPGCPCTSGS